MDEERLLIGGPRDGERMTLPGGQPAWPIDYTREDGTLGVVYYRASANPGIAICSHDAWKWITPTQYVLGSAGVYLRAINVREPYMNEPDGTKFCVSGRGHEASIHPTLEEAMEAAEASVEAGRTDA